MVPLSLHETHQGMGAQFIGLNGREAVADYGDAPAEYAALADSVGVIDCSYRSRLCVLGADRVKFLNGQVTNNVKDLRPGQGCHAALVSAKGKIQSDLNIYALENEILLDFEPGLAEAVQQRLEKYIIAEDAQVTDVSPHYGMLSVQGPKATAVLARLPWKFSIPEKPYASSKIEAPTHGEIYLMNRGISSPFVPFDAYVPSPLLPEFFSKLVTAVREAGGRPCGWSALETTRIEAGIPRFGADMDETNLAPEVLDPAAISYSKGCYIGQEVIARIRTYGQVARALRGLRLQDDLPALPARGDKLFSGDKEVGVITSATASPRLKANIALALVRREANEIGAELTVQTGAGKFPAKIVQLPF